MKTIKQIDCPNFEDCSAPLCPIDENSIRNGIWYPDEEVCRKRDVPNWVKKQKAIAKKGPPLDRYFTVEMLEVVRQVRRGIEGINADQLLEQAKEAERKWIEEKKDGRVVAKRSEPPCPVVVNKKANFVFVGGVSQKGKGGAK